MTPLHRVWVCEQCDRRCVLVRDEPPEDYHLDGGFPWCALHTRWVEANYVDREAADLLAIAADLSTATGQILAEAISMMVEE